MKKVAASILLPLLMMLSGFAQPADPNKKFAPKQLQDDLAFVKRQLFNAHANPFNQISKTDYEHAFADLNSRLTDSMTATAFYKYIKHTIVWLNDEHAQISIDPALQIDAYKNGATFLPLSLTQKGNRYFVNDILIPGTDLKKGDEISKVDGDYINLILPKCSANVAGFTEQRLRKALAQFGYLYAITIQQTRYSFKIRTAKNKDIVIQGTTLKAWQDYVTAKAGELAMHDLRITYTRYGNAGYINVSEFSARTDKDMDELKTLLNGIFKRIQDDGIKNLFIDVSKNGGGNSSVGDLLISYFYGQPYQGYQCNFRRSDEYLALITSWGMKNPSYAAQPVGKLIHFDSSKEQPFNPNPVRFNGKVYVIIGNGTFSSAIIFATTIKDNRIATLIGQIPPDGHPNHFGELYATQLPNTKLDLRFGVKEWIRPSGKRTDNVLMPDIIVDVTKAPEEVIKEVVK